MKNEQLRRDGGGRFTCPDNQRESFSNAFGIVESNDKPY